MSIVLEFKKPAPVLKEFPTVKNMRGNALDKWATVIGLRRMCMESDQMFRERLIAKMSQQGDKNGA